MCLRWIFSKIQLSPTGFPIPAMTQVRKLGIVMDPIESITPYKDSSLAMMLEAQARGWQILLFPAGRYISRQRRRHGAIQNADAV